MLRKKQVDAYIEEILKYNSVHNLVKRSSKEQIYKEDILDTLLFLDHFKAAKNILDIGTGAGIPGIVLARLWLRQLTCQAYSSEHSIHAKDQQSRHLERNVIEIFTNNPFNQSSIIQTLKLWRARLSTLLLKKTM